MSGSTKTIGRLAAALGGAAVLSISTFLPTRPSTAAAPPSPQDAAKVVEVQVKLQAPATGVAPPPAEAPVGKKVNQNITVFRPAPAGAVPAVAIEQLTQQSLQQLRPSFRAELRLLTSAAEPSPSQRTEIALEAGKILRAVALKAASARAGNQQVVVARANIPNATANDPRTQARHAFEIATRGVLSPEQLALYHRELEHKTRDRREAVVLNLVANIDKLLTLNADQRDKLCESFRAHWDDRDYPSIEMSSTYDAYLPSIPDPHIVPTLSPEQVKIWRGARKINFSALRNNPNAQQINNNQTVDLGEDDEDPDVKAALAPPETKK